MCSPQCYQAVMNQVSHDSRFLAAAGGGVANAASTSTSGAPTPKKHVGTGRIVDLTHTLTPDFPTFSGDVELELEDVSTYAEEGFNMKTWRMFEHIGTHMDAPIHCSADGLSADLIPPENLFAPLVVIDIREKAESDDDAQLTPEDIGAWIAVHGPIPDGACVAMLSGWERHLTSPRFRNVDDAGVMHFPGIHGEAAQMLLEETRAIGICVDTLSLDYGPSEDFPTHATWLPAQRWGIECLANLARVPVIGATIVVGSPKIGGATGGPTRAFALV